MKVPVEKIFVFVCLLACMFPFPAAANLRQQAVFLHDMQNCLGIVVNTFVSLQHGRQIPKQAHSSINLDGHTSSTRKIMCAVSELFDRIVDKNLLVRRMYVVANHVLPEADAPKKNDGAVQLDLFTDYAAEEEKQKAEDAALERERKIQKAALAIKKKYGKNAILKAMNLEEGATAKDRNAQIGGHKA